MTILTSYQFQSALQDELPVWIERVAQSLANLTNSVYAQMPFARSEEESMQSYLARLSDYFYQLIRVNRAYFAKLPEEMQMEFAEQVLWIEQAVYSLLRDLENHESEHTQEALQGLLETQVVFFENYENQLTSPPPMDKIVTLIKTLKDFLEKVNSHTQSRDQAVEERLRALSDQGLRLSLDQAARLGLQSIQQKRKPGRKP